MERLVEERKKRMADRKKQRKEDRRNAYYRQKEEEAQRIHEEQLKKGELLTHVLIEGIVPPPTNTIRNIIVLRFVSFSKEASVTFVVLCFFQSARSGSAWSKSSGKRRRGSTRSDCASWKSRSANNAPVSKRLRSASAAVRRSGGPRRRQR